MNAARAAELAIVEVDRDAVRLLIGRPYRTDAASAAPAPRGRRGRRRGGEASPVRHVDSRLRFLAPDDVPGASRDVEAAAVAALSAVARYLRLAERASATPLVVAREQLRRTPDGAAILSLLAAEAPEPVRILTPRQQTDLTFLAARPALAEESTTEGAEATQMIVCLAADSTEVLLASSGELTDRCPVPAGVASVAGAIPDPPTPLEWALEAARIGAALAALPAVAPWRAFAVGDGAELLAGFDSIRGEKTPAAVSLADLDRLSDDVVRSSARKTARRSGEDPSRVALVAPSALILAAVLQRFGLQRCSLLPQGLRDGIVLAATADPEGWWREDARYLEPIRGDSSGHVAEANAAV